MESIHAFVAGPWLMTDTLSVNLNIMDMQELCFQASSKKGSFSFLSCPGLR